jgi:hypothetical protein
MKHVSIAMLICGLGLVSVPSARAETPIAVIDRAAAALGGMNQVMAAKTLKIYGYGQSAYQDGGGNVTSSPNAPQKWVNIDGYRRIIDLEHGRTNVQQRNIEDFVFAFRRFMDGDLKVDNSLDGDVAFGPDDAGRIVRAPAMVARSRRIDMLDNPLSIVRAALDPATKLGEPRRIDDEWLLDMTTAQGDALVLAVNATSGLPAWLSWVAPHNNFGDVTYRTYFTGYQPVDGHGLNLPSGYNTVSNFRNVKSMLPCRTCRRRPKSAVLLRRCQIHRPSPRFRWRRAFGS